LKESSLSFVHEGHWSRGENKGKLEERTLKSLGEKREGKLSEGSKGELLSTFWRVRSNSFSKGRVPFKEGPLVTREGGYLLYL